MRTFERQILEFDRAQEAREYKESNIMAGEPDYECEEWECYCTEDGLDSTWEWSLFNRNWECEECGDQR